MKKKNRYLEPECRLIDLKPGSIICGSLDPDFDAIDATEVFSIEDVELI